MGKSNAEIRNEIYHDLRSKIFNGELTHGMRIVETKLAEEYNVNKAHVREVLQQLTNDELLTYEPMKGFFVKGISRSDILEIAKIREMLEQAIFEDFLSNAHQRDVDEAKRFTKRKIIFLKSDLKEEAFKETIATFDTVYKCTRYKRMVSMLRQYQEYIDLMIKKAFDSPDDVAKTIKNSTLLYNVFDTRDFELAKKWIHIRYENAINKIVRSI